MLRSDNYVTFVFAKIWEELPQLILGGVFFSLLAIPAFLLLSLGSLVAAILVGVLTVAPAWAALLAYEFPMVLGRVAKAMVYWKALRNYWLRSVALGSMAAFPLLSALFKLPLLQQSPVPFALWLSFAADFFVAALIAALLLYAFSIMVRDDLKLLEALRNSWILLGRHPFNTLGLLGMGILFGFAFGYFSLGLLFLLPAVYGLFIVANCELLVQREKMTR